MNSYINSIEIILYFVKNKQCEGEKMTATNGLEQIKEKYGDLTSRATDLGNQVKSQFDARSRAQSYDFRKGYNKDLDAMQRMSRGPRVAATDQNVELYGRLAEIHLDLAKLVKRYGGLNAEFKDVLNADRLCTFSQTVRVKLYRAVGKEEKADKIEMDAATSRGENITIIMDNLIQIINEQAQLSEELQETASVLQRDAITHWKYLERDMIDSLKCGYVTRRDMVDVNVTLQEVETKMRDFDEALMGYQAQVKVARDMGNLEEVTQLTSEMGQILDYKHAALDEKLNLRDLRADVHTAIMEAAERVQSAKTNLMATQTAYETIVTQRSANRKLAAKYRSMRDHMTGTLRVIARTAALQMKSSELHNFVCEVADAQERLLEATAQYAMHANSGASELLMSKLIDVEKQVEMARELQVHREMVEEKEQQWADAWNQMGSGSIDEHFDTY